MKKILKIFLIIVVLSVLSHGCSSDKTASEPENRTLSEQTAETAVVKEAVNDFAEGKNITVSFGDYQAEVPEKWKSKDNIYYFDEESTERNFVTFITHEITEVKVDDQFIRNDRQLVYNFCSGTNLQRETDSLLRIGDIQGRKAEYIDNSGDSPYHVVYFYFKNTDPEGIAAIIYSVQDNNKYDHTEDLNAVIHSLHRNVERTAAVPEIPQAVETNPDKEKLLAAKVSFVTDTLEYSNKEVDPLTLIICDDPEITVTAENAINLANISEQTVIYVLASGDETTRIEKKFEIVDNKAPEIELKETDVSVEYGSSYDPSSNIAAVHDPVDGDLKRVASEKEQVIGTYYIEGSADTNKPGRYSFKVHAIDNNTNITIKEFTVTVGPEPYKEPTFDYIANKNSKKFHYPDCKSVSKMKEKNKKYFEDVTRDYMIEHGYSPCGNCNP